MIHMKCLVLFFSEDLIQIKKININPKKLQQQY